MNDAPRDLPSQPASVHALEKLADELDPHDFATTLTARRGHPPHLTVTSRHAAIGDDIQASHHAYWWSWGERIGPASDPHAAARKITGVLRALPLPVHD